MIFTYLFAAGYMRATLGLLPSRFETRTGDPQRLAERMLVLAIITRTLKSLPTAAAGAVLLAAAMLSICCPSGAPSLLAIAHADTSPAPAAIGATNTSVTHDCASQPAVTINGASAIVTLTGSCGDVNVAGANNTLHLATVAQIEATGTGNTTTWQSGPNDVAPQISNTGTRNTVNQG